MSNQCLDHLNFIGSTCPDCDLEVDDHGNTEDTFEFCSYPDCGCDGARLCMAGKANPAATTLNLEKGAFSRLFALLADKEQ